MYAKMVCPGADVAGAILGICTSTGQAPVINCTAGNTPIDGRCLRGTYPGI